MQTEQLIEEAKRKLNKIYNKHEHYFQDVNNEGFAQNDYDKIFNDFENLLTKAISTIATKSAEVERNRIANSIQYEAEEFEKYMTEKHLD